jgi:hypothetical protein
MGIFGLKIYHLATQVSCDTARPKFRSILTCVARRRTTPCDKNSVFASTVLSRTNHSLAAILHVVGFLIQCCKTVHCLKSSQYGSL